MTVVVTPLSGSEKLRFREGNVSPSTELGLYEPIRGEDRGICWFRYPCFRTKTHIVNFKELTLAKIVSIHGSISELESFVMRNEYLNKVEDNASNELQELKDIWAQWDDEAKQLFYQNYGDLPYLLDVKVDRHLFRAMALGHIDETVADLFNRLGKQNTPVPAILAETLRSLSACRRAGEGRFIGYAHLLLVWFHSHFWKLDKVPCRVFFEGYSPLKEAVDMPRRDDISEERWIDILQNLREEDFMWKAPWQYRARQFIPATQSLAQSDFSYKGDHYKKRMREISEAWKKPFCMKILTKGSTSTLKYKGWFGRRVNDNIPRPILGVARSLEESLRVIPSKVQVMK
ncbi:hypothetical protein CXB51_033980 [Gossypium anomalum]|uniref:DUF7745 domain-containing protein n=1 Tax=Gossypium anomalum TaxID=47600 RepID=A0A8J5YAS4_9ROSI|nr:hypothetical protein CXB51_033980 [Gossypium anomalum]